MYLIGLSFRIDLFGKYIGILLSGYTLFNT